MRFLRLLVGRASKQAAECGPQFPYGIDAEAYGEGWTSPASQVDRRAHRSQGWTPLDFRHALDGAFCEEITVEDAPLVTDAMMTDFDTQEMPAPVFPVCAR